ncbi:MAG TPA: hypothetical protein VGS07_06470 [Thermoanaerobaculia bacterium]|jgi:5-methylcytosine-specific restriction endonuclease McrA|nr:hypothetical protein [Thermoanaerobaculia bacterium]
MIRYPVARAELEEMVRAESGTWLDEARKKTAAFRGLGHYEEEAGTWSVIKGAYMKLQHAKCAYCERKAGEDDESKIEHDVEHFRPKSKVREWPPKKRKLTYSFATGEAADVGYYLLAYNLFNYAVACKKCNTIYKSDYFPIAGKARVVDRDEAQDLAAEEPFLIYPVGDVDEDPEDLITFQGLIPMPRHDAGRPHDRARVTIDFFKLDVRSELIFQRALILKSLYWALDDLKTAQDPRRRKAAQQTVDLALSPASPHTSCARAFHALCTEDPQTASLFYDAVAEYLEKRKY